MRKHTLPEFHKDSSSPIPAFAVAITHSQSIFGELNPASFSSEKEILFEESMYVFVFVVVNKKKGVSALFWKNWIVAFGRTAYVHLLSISYIFWLL